MSATQFEAFLARLYVDPEVRAKPTRAPKQKSRPFR